MKTAFVSDIHGNLAALKAVFADIDKYQPDKIISLGDTVGYGPQPRECLAMVREKCSMVLMGNHEHAVLNGAEHFTPLARIAIDWTAQQLREPEIGRNSTRRIRRQQCGGLRVASLPPERGRQS